MKTSKWSLSNRCGSINLFGGGGGAVSEAESCLREVRSEVESQEQSELCVSG